MIKITRVTSSGSGEIAGHELEVDGKQYCVFEDSESMPGIRIGSIVAGLDEVLVRELVFSHLSEKDIYQNNKEPESV